MYYLETREYFVSRDVIVHDQVFSFVDSTNGLLHLKNDSELGDDGVYDHWPSEDDVRDLPTGRKQTGTAVQSEAIQGMDEALHECSEVLGVSSAVLAHAVSEGSLVHCDALHQASDEVREALAEAPDEAIEAQAQALIEALGEAHVLMQPVQQRVFVSASDQQPVQQ